MKKLFYVLQLLLLLTGARPVWGQALYDGGVHLQSPQIWSFMKYTHLNSVDHYTGTLHLQIPLYTYKDNDFELPISVDYASSGYMPNVQTSILGLGWILNAGGCITREVRGMADDTEFSGSDIALRYGYLYHHLAPTTPTTDWNSILDFNFNFQGGHSNEFCFPYNQNNWLCETRSDIYHFKFGEHRGSFVLGPGRTVYVYNTTRPSGEYKIDVSQMERTYKLTITTGDGYQYTFNSFRFLDHVSIDDDPDCKIPQTKYNLTWLLERIKAPNNRTVELAYSETQSFDLWKPTAFIAAEKSYATSSEWFADVSEYYSYSKESRQNYAHQNGKNLQQIKVDNKLIIRFIYEEKQSEQSVGIRIDMAKLKDVANLGKLKNIEVIDTSGDTLRNFRFNYSEDAPSEGNPMTFLKGLVIDHKEEYEFSYYNESTPFPYHGAVNFDHWGYNNRTNGYNYNPRTLIPLLNIDAQFNEQNITSQREPNAAGAMMGMLKRISYPTKGYSEFEYEGNSYSKKVGRNYTTNGNPALLSNSVGGFNYSDPLNYPAGGVRIKKAAHFDQNNACCEVKEYSYVDANNNSTGILLHYPRYLDGVSIQHTLGQYANIYRRSGSNLFALSADKHHIGYSRVREKNGDGSYIDYYYTNYADTPDEINTGLIRPLDSYINLPYAVTYPQCAINLYRDPVSNHRMRGLLKHKLSYNNHDSLVLRQSYTYRHVPKFAECIELMWGYAYVHKTPVGDVLKEKELTTSYFNNGDSLQTTITYRYNAQGQQTEERIENSRSRNLIKKTIFPQEVQGNQNYSYITSTNYWQAMISADYIATPLIEAQYIDSKLTGATRYAYTMRSTADGNWFKVRSIYKSELQGLLDETAILPFDTKGADLEFSFDLFDTYGNVIQTTSRDGRVTSYVWGHRGQYMVAKIVGMRFEEVKRIVGESQFSGDALTSPTLTDTACESLRNSAHTYVTTYTYKPYVGMTSQTDPSGRKTFYEYDHMGRLSLIKDQRGNSVEGYMYNFKQ